jgi:hypothetical protein
MAKEDQNPFDQFKAPPAPAKVKADVNPFDQFKPKRAKRERTGMDKATQIAGVTTNALLPYATAAGLGAAAGAPFGGVGAVPGAAGGVLALGVGDLGTGIYNLGASLFDADRIPLPSETISKGYRSAGIGRAPETPGEQVYSDVLQAAASGGGQAKAAQNLVGSAAPRAQNFMRGLGQNARGQTAASVGAAAAPSVASNYLDVENPYALAGLSLAGGLAGAKAGTPATKPVTAAALREESGNLYRAMEAENVNIAPQAMTDLALAARKKIGNLRYDPDTDKLVTQALDLFGKKSGKPLSFEMLEEFRKSIRDLPYTQSGAGRGTPKERAIIAALDDTIDDYMDGLTPAQVTSGDATSASALLKQARNVRARGYQTETLEDAFTKATATSEALNSTKSFPQALRDEFGKIAKNQRKLSKFDAPTQALIKKVANGTATQKVLMTLGKLSPSASLFGTQMPVYGVGYGGLATMSPTAAAGVATAQTAGAIAKGAANRMTRTQANRALVNAAQPGGGVKPGGPGYFVASPVAQQNVLAQDRAKKAAERRRLGF